MMFDEKTNHLYTTQGMTQENRNAFTTLTPGANIQDVHQAENGMFRDSRGDYRDVKGTKHMPDGLPSLTFPNTKGLGMGRRLGA